jgi:hypothetical protein
MNNIFIDTYNPTFQEVAMVVVITALAAVCFVVIM